MKKYLLPLFLVLVVVVSSFAVLADDSTSDSESSEGTTYAEDHPSETWHKMNWAEKLIQKLMDLFGLTEDNSIGDLLDAIHGEKQDVTQSEMDRLGVDSLEELQDAIKEQHVDKIREILGLSDDLSDEEVLAIAKEQHRQAVLDLLGLDSDASKEEIQQAMHDWREENQPILRGMHRGFLNRFKH